MKKAEKHLKNNIMDDKDKMFDEENWDNEKFEEIDESKSEDLKPHKTK